MRNSIKTQKLSAFILLIIFSIQTFWPGISYALTSGPTTPEMKAFEPASVSDMVDLFSGDFSYNIPLMDVGGYPVNIAYHAGSHPEEEASWVGFGWSLNPGAINRQLRGLPDDFDGKGNNGDKIVQYDNKKPNVTVGANINVSGKIFGKRFGNVKIKLGIAHNNYTGYKGLIGLGTAFTTSKDNATSETQNMGSDENKSGGFGGTLSAGINVDNQSGINPYADFNINYKSKVKKDAEAERTNKAADDYERNCKQANDDGKLTPEQKESLKELKKEANNAQADANHEANKGFSNGASIDFAGFQAPQQIQLPMKSNSFSASLAFGAYFTGWTVDFGIEGTLSKQELANKVNVAPAYGFSNSYKGKEDESSLLDYNMEKENPYNKALPNLGVPVFTPDYFNVSSNAGSMQFRSYARGTGIFRKPLMEEPTELSGNIGIELAGGNIFHFGVPLQINLSNSHTGQWNSKNEFADVGDFKTTDATKLDNQDFYFKRVGEKNKQDDAYFSTLGNTQPVAVKLSKGFNSWAFGKATANKELRLKNGSFGVGSLGRTVRDKANHSISFLTAVEASKYALDKNILDYKENVLPTKTGAFTATDRYPQVKFFHWFPFSFPYSDPTFNYRKAHHISQFTITQDNGQRMIYGLPVYNIQQEEASFAIDHSQQETDPKYKGFARYGGSDNTINNGKGKDNYFHKSITPSYTTGHLLTGILSPDYVDVTGDGISDDDLGTAVKFNYSKLPQTYKWRTPYTNANSNTNIANYNEGNKSITEDDKANYTWGEKEIWNMHSIESKTMVALFVTSPRTDGIGVYGENGGKNVSARLKKLDEIRLYSKSELYANPSNPTPIKVVHFEYNESLINGLPNSATNKGKLTLKAVWFSYGNNPKGKFHQYKFSYKIPSGSYADCNDYKDFQSDRWGVFKDKSRNPNGLDNLEFSYATQKKKDADEFVSFWQLNQIEIPSGAIINVDYESDDYAYVQDRRATEMCFIAGLDNNGQTTGFSEAEYMYVKLPQPVADLAELSKRYFNGLSCLAYRAFVDMDGNGHWEYVAGYAKIDFGDVSKPPIIFVNSTTAKVRVEKIGGYNPIAKASWQKLKLEVPKYSYPEYDNLDADESGFITAIKALGATFARFGDLVENFDHRAQRKHFGDHIDLSKSWVRLCTPVGSNTDDATKTSSEKVFGKLGGGLRVKAITINDKWAAMSGVGSNAVLGQEYDYTTKNDKNETISSGVATYEPSLGADENPFKEPISYTERKTFCQPKYFYLERPMGEAYFPGPSIGYSKVTVKSIAASGEIGLDGTSISEFYTAKDFPTKVDEVSMEPITPHMNFLPRLFGLKLTAAVTLSQGYSVENNDMHGKPKSQVVLGKNGNKVSTVDYYYKVKNEKAATLELDNNVAVVDKNGLVNNDPRTIVGMDVDMFTEMMESSSENMGIAIDPSFGVFLAGFWPVFSVTMPWPKANYEKRLYRSSSSIKLVNRFGILDHTVKTVNGSTSTTQNLLWDEETGEVLLTKTNNEFKDDVYNFSYPAHWFYDGMGSAFKNEGVLLAGFNTDGAGQINSGFTRYLIEGDELIEMNGNGKYWVTKPNATNELFLIDINGALVKNLTTNIKIMRSGRRNLAIASVGSVVSLTNPIYTDETTGIPRIEFNKIIQRIKGSTIVLHDPKILQAKAVEYSNEWQVPVADEVKLIDGDMPTDCEDITRSSTPASYSSCICKCLKQLFDYLLSDKIENRLFKYKAIDKKTVGEVAMEAGIVINSANSCSLLDENANEPFYSLTDENSRKIYKLRIGKCIVSLKSYDLTKDLNYYDLHSMECSNSHEPFVEFRYYGPEMNASINTECTTNEIYNWSSGSVQRDYNSQMILVGESLYSSGGIDKLVTTFSTFKDLNTILPTNTIIKNAKLNLFYSTQASGFSSNGGHSATNSSNNFISTQFGVWHNVIKYKPDGCIDLDNYAVPAFIDNFPNIVIPNAISNTQDFQIDVTPFIAGMVRFGKNKFVIGDQSNTTDGHQPSYYFTFISENSTLATKHPKLNVNYIIPSAPIAKLEIESCTQPVCKPSATINPYTKGLLGNWRTKKELLYGTKRVQDVVVKTEHIKQKGSFASFTPYNWATGATNTNWQWTSQVNKFNRKGQEVENVDPLNRLSAAQYGYIESVPVAVGSNARYREIGYDGFEDYNFSLGNKSNPIPGKCGIQDHFSFRTSLSSNVLLDNSISHSGNYSLKINAGNIASIAKPTLLNEPAKIHTIVANEYQIDAANNGNYLRFGFMPQPSTPTQTQKYILSGWVYDGDKANNAISSNFTLNINGVVLNVNDDTKFSKVYTVEGWKRFEIVFDMPLQATATDPLPDIAIDFGATGGSINIDDVRIHPYKSQLKSFAYDANSMRLMAELDENNFATFYEYDDEGTLIRVKKETEKGISTIKETRSSIRKP